MRIFIAIIAASLCFTDGYCQKTISVSAGFAQVLNQGSVKDKYLSPGKLPVGFAFGVSYLHNSSKQISFSGSIGCIRKGFIRPLSNIVSDAGFGTKVKISYLFISPRVSFKLRDDTKRSLFITSGPYMALALSGRESGSEETIYGLRPYSGSIYIGNDAVLKTNHAQVKNNDIGINSSFIYLHDQYGIMLNWQKGLKNIITDIPFSNQHFFQNNSLDLSLFYQFDLVHRKSKNGSVKCMPLTNTPKINSKE